GAKPPDRPGAGRGARLVRSRPRQATAAGSSTSPPAGSGADGATSTVTCPPRGTSDPPGGDWASTAPGAPERRPLTTSGSKPAASSSSRARSADMPTTLGTGEGGGSSPSPGSRAGAVVAVVGGGAAK